MSHPKCKHVGDLAEQLAAAQATIAEMRRAFEILSQTDNLRVSVITRNMLALHPHAALVAKLKADAVVEFASRYFAHREYFGETINDDAQEYADSIEKGQQP